MYTDPPVIPNTGTENDRHLSVEQTSIALGQILMGRIQHILDLELYAFVAQVLVHGHGVSVNRLQKFRDLQSGVHVLLRVCVNVRLWLRRGYMCVKG